MRGMGRLWQAAGTVNAVFAPDLLERAVDAGLRSLFVGFETLNPANRRAAEMPEHAPAHDYASAIRRLHDLGVMINGSFVWMDEADGSVFERTVEWAIEQGSRPRRITSSPPTRARRSTSACRIRGD